MKAENLFSSRSLKLRLALAWLSILTPAWAADIMPNLTFTDCTANSATIILEATNGPAFNLEYKADLSTTWTILGPGTVIDDTHVRFVDTSIGSVNWRLYRATGPDSVFARNIVGFTKTNLPAQNFSLLNNPFASTNLITTVFPSAPDGTFIWKATGSAIVPWDVNVYSEARGWWNTNINLTGPFWIYNPSTEPISIIFKGDLSLSAGRWSAGILLCSLTYPVSISDLHLLGTTYLHVRSGTGWQFYTYTYDGEYGYGSWYPSAPEIPLGTSFYLDTRQWQPLPEVIMMDPILIMPQSSVQQVTFSGISYSGDNISSIRTSDITDQSGHRLAGSNYHAAIYAGPMNATEAQLTMMGAPVCLPEGEWAGVLPPISLDLTPLAPPARFQVRAWEGADVTSYEAAVSQGLRAGKSVLQQTPLFGSTLPTPVLASGFYDFSIVPTTTAPTISHNPTNVIVSAGAPVTFTAQASASVIKYQWRFNGANLVNQTNATLTLTNAQCADCGVYDVSVSNPAGTNISSGASLSVTQINPDFTLNVCGPIGAQYQVQSNNILTTNNWQPWTNFTLTTSPFTLTNLNVDQPQTRFFKTVKLP